jgi:hypothetical protein
LSVVEIFGQSLGTTNETIHLLDPPGSGSMDPALDLHLDPDPFHSYQRTRLTYHRTTEDKDEGSSFNNKDNWITEQKRMAGSGIHRIQWPVPDSAGSMHPTPDLDPNPSHSYSVPVHRKLQPLSGIKTRITGPINTSYNETGAIRDLRSGRDSSTFFF